MILHPDAGYEEFCDYVIGLKGPKTESELRDLWEYRQKLLGIRIDTGRGYRAQLPADEQHLTLREREHKIIAEATADGKTIERAPA